MGKSGRVRLGDLRRAYRLIHDARDVGLDPAAWPVVVVEGLIALIGSQSCVIGEMSFAPPRASLLADRGWESPRQREIWHRRYVIEQDFRGILTYQRFASALSGPLTTRGREQLVDDPEWYRSVEFNEIMRPMEQDDLLFSFAPVDGGRAMVGLSSTRMLGDRRFAPRERRLLRLFHAELSRHMGSALVRTPADLFACLPPRLRRTLDCLLEGDSEGQAALRLGLSRHTVHEYVTKLYRHFGVARRAELMARCARLRAPSSPPD
jgi:DNA-binding CsgD family transcriptional regulator